MGFRPTFLATIVFLPVFVVLLGLGTWQVQRLAWKNDLIETRADRIAAPPLSVVQAKAAGLPGEIEYRPIRLTGVFQPDHRFRLLNRIYAGTQGSHLIVPMVLENGQGTVMVDRGWIPRGPLENISDEPESVITLSGYVRAYTDPGAFLPPNEPGPNNWFHMHEDEMLAASGLTDGVGFYVEAGPGRNPPGTYPVGAVPNVNLRNSHLQYAGTWYGLAGVLLVIFIVYHWRRSPE
jgi:surfeit locus 1 family protein